jgi:hypothetical protein
VVTRAAGLLPCSQTAGDSGCSKDAEEGNGVGSRTLARAKRGQLGTAEEKIAAQREPSFTRSFGPYDILSARPAGPLTRSRPGKP